MKNTTFSALGLILIFLISCKDKTAPKPTANINDILGTWVSVDSCITKRGDKFLYTHDSLFIRKDALIGSVNYPIYIEMRGYSFAYYSAKYFGPDSLILSYIGPTNIGFINNNFRHKVLFNPGKDTMSLIDFRKTYPYSPFNEFYKIK